MKKLILGLLLSTMLCVTACGNDTTTDKNTTDKGVVTIYEITATFKPCTKGSGRLPDDLRW